MKATISFNLPEEQEEFMLAANAAKYKSALFEISQQIFRPARKHGYADAEMKQFCDESGFLRDDVVELIAILESKFFDILREEEVEI